MELKEIESWPSVATLSKLDDLPRDAANPMRQCQVRPMSAYAHVNASLFDLALARYVYVYGCDL
jgi:hypothetical protein